MLDVDAEVGFLLRDCDACRPLSARLVARRLLGPDAIVEYPGVSWGPDGTRVIVHGQQKIAVRGHLSVPRERWVIFHELAEWHIDRIGYTEHDKEAVAESITAALIAPREAYRRALKQHGRRFPKLATFFMTTQTSAALRLGEVTGVPVAVVAPTHVRVRGDEEWIWPPEPELHGLATARRMPKGLPVKRVPLTDDRRRRVLLAS